MHPTITIHLKDNLDSELATINVPVPLAPTTHGYQLYDAEQFEQLLDKATRAFRQVFDQATNQ